MDYDEEGFVVVVAAAGGEVTVVAVGDAAAYLWPLLVQILHTQNHKFHPPLYPRDNLTAIKRIK